MPHYPFPYFIPCKDSHFLQSKNQSPTNDLKTIYLCMRINIKLDFPLPLWPQLLSLPCTLFHPHSLPYSPMSIQTCSHFRVKLGTPTALKCFPQKATPIVSPLLENPYACSGKPFKSSNQLRIPNLSYPSLFSSIAPVSFQNISNVYVVYH